MLKKLFLLFILLPSIVLSNWDIIEVPLNKEETLFKKELMIELNSSKDVFTIISISDKEIVFTIFKKNGENLFKKDNTIFRFKVNSTLIECIPTYGHTFGDNTTFSISTLIIEGKNKNELIETFKRGNELKLLIMNSDGIKMFFDIPLNTFNKKINEIE